MLTAQQLETLQKLADSEEGEIVCEGKQCYIDLTSVDKRDVYALLRVTAISDATDEGGALERYRLNSTGRSILFNPEIEHQITQALQQSGHSAFTIENHTVKPI